MLCNCLRSTQAWSRLHMQKKLFRSWSPKHDSWSGAVSTIRPLSSDSQVALHRRPQESPYSNSVAGCIPRQSHCLRYFSTANRMLAKLSPEDVRTRVNELTDLFTEAREMLEDARESVGTTYFSDDMEDAQTAVSNTLSSYEALLAELDEQQKEDVVRTIGLRMEELKAQERAIKEMLD